MPRLAEHKPLNPIERAEILFWASQPTAEEEDALEARLEPLLAPLKE